jgi:predicted AAA+ superfamily ATPase
MIHRLLKTSNSLTFFLFGPRGVGKSTWLKEQTVNLGKNLWIDLLNQRTELQLRQNPDLLVNLWQGAERPKLVVIDEVQKIPELLNVVHFMIEEYKVRFILTGSSARKLKRGGANLLGSRAAEKNLFPFSSVELQEKFDLKKALKFGLLPKIYLEDLSDQDRSDLLYGYISTYLKEEVAAEQLVRNLDPFRRFLVAAAQMNTKKINHSKLERDAGIGTRQSERNFDILVDTLLGTFLEPFDHSIRKRQTQRSKFYFFDTGVVRALQDLAGEELVNQSYEFGDLFETFLFNEFIKLKSYLGLRWKFSYLSTKDDSEIDLVIEKPRGKPILVEIKSAESLNEDHLNSLRKLKRDLPHQTAYCLSRQKTVQEIDGIRCLPWQKGLVEIFELDE